MHSQDEKLTTTKMTVNQNEMKSLKKIKLAAKIFSLNIKKSIEEFKIYRNTYIEISNLPIY